MPGTSEPENYYFCRPRPLMSNCQITFEQFGNQQPLKRPQKFEKGSPTFLHVVSPQLTALASAGGKDTFQGEKVLDST
jgi:hypothetical protein